MILSFQDDSEGRRRRRPDPEEPPAAEPRRPRRKRPPEDVGQALRAAYQRMIDEDIPPEMLDLLGKLG